MELWSKTYFFFFFQWPRIALVGRFKSPAKAPDHLCGGISSFAGGFLLRTDAEWGLFIYLFILKTKVLNSFRLRPSNSRFCGESGAQPVWDMAPLATLAAKGILQTKIPPARFIC